MSHHLHERDASGGALRGVPTPLIASEWVREVRLVVSVAHGGPTGRDGSPLLPAWRFSVCRALFVGRAWERRLGGVAGLWLVGTSRCGYALGDLLSGSRRARRRLLGCDGRLSKRWQCHRCARADAPVV